MSLDETRHLAAIYISIDGREKTQTATWRLQHHFIAFSFVKISKYILAYKKRLVIEKKPKHLLLGLLPIAIVYENMSACSSLLWTLTNPTYFRRQSGTNLISKVTVYQWIPGIYNLNTRLSCHTRKIIAYQTFYFLFHWQIN